MLAFVLLRLARIYGDDELEHRAAGVLRLLHTNLGRIPTAFGWALCALDLYLSPPRELAIIGAPEDEVARARARAVRAERRRRLRPERSRAAARRQDPRRRQADALRLRALRVPGAGTTSDRRTPRAGRSPRSKRATSNADRSSVGSFPSDQLRHVLADRGRLLEAVAGESGRVEEAFRLGRPPDQGVVVGAHLVIAPPRRLHRQVAEQRQPAQRRAPRPPRASAPFRRRRARAPRGGSRTTWRSRSSAAAARAGRRPRARTTSSASRPSTGRSRPAIAATSCDQAPAQQTSVPQPIGPFEVSTAATRPASTRTPVTSQPCRTSIPRAYHWTTDSGRCVPVELAEGRRQQAVRLELGDDRERLLHRQLARGNAQPVLERERLAERGDVLVVDRAGTGSRSWRKSIPSIRSNSAIERRAIRMFSSSENCARIPPAEREVEPAASESRSSSTTSSTPELAQVPRDARPHRAAAHDHHLVCLHAP